MLNDVEFQKGSNLVIDDFFLIISPKKLRWVAGKSTIGITTP